MTALATPLRAIAEAVRAKGVQISHEGVAGSGILILSHTSASTSSR